ncbi:MAG: hypothetical protein ACI92C_002910, partial [Neolewinella sp.]
FPSKPTRTSHNYLYFTTNPAPNTRKKHKI